MHESTTPRADQEIVLIGWTGLLIPFVVVLGAAFALGARSAKQIATTSLLLGFAVAIGLLRWRARCASQR